jgi:hypothetical protein
MHCSFSSQTLAVSRAQEPQRGSWVATRRGLNQPVSSSPPLRTGLAPVQASGSAPLIVLPGVPRKRRCPLRQFHRCPPAYRWRVHWVPLLPSAPRLGAFAGRPRPGGPCLPGRRLLCPGRLCVRALAFRRLPRLWPQGRTGAPWSPGPCPLAGLACSLLSALVSAFRLVWLTS